MNEQTEKQKNFDEVTAAPDKYIGLGGVERQVLLRGHKVNLETQSVGKKYLVRQRIFSFSNTLGPYEVLPDHQDFVRFDDRDEAERLFEMIEAGQVNIENLIYTG